MTRKRKLASETVDSLDFFPKPRGADPDTGPHDNTRAKTALRAPNDKTESEADGTSDEGESELNSDKEKESDSEEMNGNGNDNELNVNGNENERDHDAEVMMGADEIMEDSAIEEDRGAHSNSNLSLFSFGGSPLQEREDAERAAFLLRRRQRQQQRDAEAAQLPPPPNPRPPDWRAERAERHRRLAQEQMEMGGARVEGMDGLEEDRRMRESDEDEEVEGEEDGEGEEGDATLPEFTSIDESFLNLSMNEDVGADAARVREGEERRAEEDGGVRGDAGDAGAAILPADVNMAAEDGEDAAAEQPIPPPPPAGVPPIVLAAAANLPDDGLNVLGMDMYLDDGEVGGVLRPPQNGAGAAVQEPPPMILDDAANGVPEREVEQQEVGYRGGNRIALDPTLINSLIDLIRNHPIIGLHAVRYEFRRVMKLLHSAVFQCAQPEQSVKFFRNSWIVESNLVYTSYLTPGDVYEIRTNPPADVIGVEFINSPTTVCAQLKIVSTTVAKGHVLSEGIRLCGRPLPVFFPFASADIDLNRIHLFGKEFDVRFESTELNDFVPQVMKALGARTIELNRERNAGTVYFNSAILCQKIAFLLNGCLLGGLQVHVLLPEL